jgi:putative transposase
MLVGVDPKTVRRNRLPDNPEIREEMQAIAAVRRRFGYRRIGVLLERKGMTMNHKKLYRLYTEEKLGVRRRRGRKRARGSRTPPLTHASMCCRATDASGAASGRAPPLGDASITCRSKGSLDFVSDTFGASRKFRMLAVNDDCCRENLCLPLGRLLRNHLPGDGWLTPAYQERGWHGNWTRLCAYSTEQRRTVTWRVALRHSLAPYIIY